MNFGFLVFLGCAAVFYALSVNAMISKLPVGIWSHEKERPKVSDVKAYNHAVARMFAAYASLLILASLPILFKMGEVWVLMISVLGIISITLGLLVAAVRIDQKYRRR